MAACLKLMAANDPQSVMPEAGRIIVLLDVCFRQVHPGVHGALFRPVLI